MSGRPRYTVVTDQSRLGRWLTSRTEAERIAARWVKHGLGHVRVLNQDGRTVEPRSSVGRDFDKRALLKSIDKDIKAANRAKLAALRTKIREAVALRKSGRAGLREFCALERQRGRQRIEALRAELKAAASSVRLEARGNCQRARRAPGVEIARLRLELETERRFLAEMRRIEAGNRARGRRPGLATARVRQGESDDEVRSNIPADLVPLFNRIRWTIKASPRKSRTEAFLEYVEAHPGEEYQAIDDKTDALVRELERRQRAGGRR